MSVLVSEVWLVVNSKPCWRCGCVKCGRGVHCLHGAHLAARSTLARDRLGAQSCGVEARTCTLGGKCSLLTDTMTEVLEAVGSFKAALGMP